MDVLKQCQFWNENDEYKKIIDALEAIDDRTPEMDSELARAYNNYGSFGDGAHAEECYENALDLLLPHEEYFKGDHLWNFRVGYSYFYLGEEGKALPYFEAALKARPGDEDTKWFIGECKKFLHYKEIEKERQKQRMEIEKEFMAEAQAKMMEMQKNSVELLISGKGTYRLGGTRFGGKPDVPKDFVWPRYEGHSVPKEKAKDRPLSFLVQLNCEELAGCDTEHLLPDHGVLSFFYEMVSQRWGYDPKDKGCAKVYWFPDVSALSEVDFPADLEEDFRYPIKEIKMKNHKSYPAPEDFPLLNYDPVKRDIYEDMLEKEGDKVEEDRTQLLGWPTVIQGSMFAECELASKGYYLGNGWDHVPEDVKEKALTKASEDWQLLLQLSSLDEGEEEVLMFGDCGKIYFFIKKEDLKKRNFDSIWLVLQCY